MARMLSVRLQKMPRPREGAPWLDSMGASCRDVHRLSARFAAVSKSGSISDPGLHKRRASAGRRERVQLRRLGEELQLGVLLLRVPKRPLVPKQHQRLPVAIGDRLAVAFPIERLRLPWAGYPPRDLEGELVEADA